MSINILSGNGEVMPMSGLLELYRAPDPVLAGRIVAILADHDIEAIIFDQNVSSIEPGMYLFGRRIMVASSEFDRARAIVAMEDPDLRNGLNVRD